MGRLSGGELKEVSSQEFVMDEDFGKLVSLIYRNNCIGDGGDSDLSDLSDSLSTPPQSPRVRDSPLQFMEEEDDDIQQVQQVQQEDEEGNPMFPDGVLDNMDFEDGMLFEGPNYAVNFYRNMEIRRNDREFADGVVRESIYKV